MTEFKVNNFISLQLEDNETVIYANGKKFLQCKSILINRKISDLEELPFDDSIDGLKEYLNKSSERYRIVISPETEFWAHCSNLQTWYESNYDMKLIHSNLGFPLLKELVNLGELKAKRVFREEILKRLESNNLQTVSYLVNEGYINYLSREDILFSLLNCKEAETMLKLEKELDMKLNISIDKDDNPPSNGFLIDNKIVAGIKLTLRDISNRIEVIFGLFSKLKGLLILELSKCKIIEVPSSVNKLEKLNYLLLCNNEIKIIPEAIWDLVELMELDLSFNRLSEVSSSIGRLTDLGSLNLRNNQILKIPQAVNKCTKLWNLDLRNNYISALPAGIADNDMLKYLYIDNNHFLHPRQIRKKLLKKKKFRILSV